MYETVEKPWGKYTIIDRGEGYQVKRHIVNPFSKLSLQKHNHRSEHWIVVSGEAKIVNGDKEMTLKINESTFVPVNTVHRFMNSGKTPLIVIEIQTGEYLGEDDIVRFEDDYGRENK